MGRSRLDNPAIFHDRDELAVAYGDIDDLAWRETAQPGGGVIRIIEVLISAQHHEKSAEGKNTFDDKPAAGKAGGGLAGP